MVINDLTSPLIGSIVIETKDRTLHILSPFVGEVDCPYDDSDGTYHVPADALLPRLTVTPAECAKMLGVSLSRVSRMCHNGMLRSAKVGSARLIDYWSAREMLDGRSNDGLADGNAD